MDNEDIVDWQAKYERAQSDILDLRQQLAAVRAQTVIKLNNAQREIDSKTQMYLGAMAEIERLKGLLPLTEQERIDLSLGAHPNDP